MKYWKKLRLLAEPPLPPSPTEVQPNKIFFSHKKVQPSLTPHFYIKQNFLHNKVHRSAYPLTPPHVQ